MLEPGTHQVVILIGARDGTLNVLGNIDVEIIKHTPSKGIEDDQRVAAYVDTSTITAGLRAIADRMDETASAQAPPTS